MKSKSILDRAIAVVLIAVLGGAALAQTAQELSPRGVMIEFKVFEVSQGYDYSFQASSGTRKKDYQIIVLSDSGLLDRLAKAAKEAGVKALAAPKVRTLDGMQAMIAQSIRVGADSRARIKFEAKPAVKPEGLQLDMNLGLFSGVEGSPEFRSYWSSRDTVSVASGMPILLDFAVKDSEGGVHRFLVFVKGEVMPLGG